MLADHGCHDLASCWLTMHAMTWPHAGYVHTNVYSHIEEQHLIEERCVEGGRDEQGVLLASHAVCCGGPGRVSSQHVPAWNTYVTTDIPDVANQKVTISTYMFVLTYL